MSDEDTIVAAEFTAALHRLVAINFCVGASSVSEYRLAVVRMLRDIADDLARDIPRETICPSRR